MTFSLDLSSWLVKGLVRKKGITEQIYMGTGSFSRTDLNRINGIVQNTQLSYPKELVISILREEFGKDSYYHYVSDPWGFPLTRDLTGIETDAGFDDDVTTRIFIGEEYRHDAIFYPAIFVRDGGHSYKPVAMNRNKETVQNEATLVVDGYGNEKIFISPKSFTLAGAWEGQIQVEIKTRDILARDQIAEFCSILFTDLRFEEFLKAGIIIKSVNTGSPSQDQDRQQDPLYLRTITLDIRSEWRREIPIDNIVDVINICVDIGRLDVEPPQFDPNIQINTCVDVIQAIDEML